VNLLALYYLVRYNLYNGNLNTQYIQSKRVYVTSSEGEKQRQVLCRERCAGRERNSRYLSVTTFPKHQSAR
jgi:hypothetical protein